MCASTARLLFLFFFRFNYCVSECFIGIYDVHTCTPGVHGVQRRASDTLELIAKVCELPYTRWEPNWGPLEGHQVLITLSPSFRPTLLLIKTYKSRVKARACLRKSHLNLLSLARTILKWGSEPSWRLLEKLFLLRPVI